MAEPIRAKYQSTTNQSKEAPARENTAEYLLFTCQIIESHILIVEAGGVECPVRYRSLGKLGVSMNIRHFLGVICAKNLRESGISSPLWGAPLRNSISAGGVCAK